MLANACNAAETINCACAVPETTVQDPVLQRTMQIIDSLVCDPM